MHRIALIFSLVCYFISTNANRETICVLRKSRTPTDPPGVLLRCNFYGNESTPVQFDEVLQMVTSRRYYDDLERYVPFNIKNASLEEIVEMDLKVEDENVVIFLNGLSSCPRLINLEIMNWRGKKFTLNISPDEFNQTPNLTTLRLNPHNYNDDDFIRAIGSLKDRLEKFTIEFWGPRAGFDNESRSLLLLQQLQNFTNLRHLRFGHSGAIMPINIFAGSAHCLETVTIFYIKIPTITSGMFKGMRKLKQLQLIKPELTKIEDGAFDDLVELETLEIMFGYNLPTLPDGLFQNMKKLKLVTLWESNRIENLSRENFTHCDAFEEFDMKYFPI